MSATDDADDLDLPAAERDAISTGAAADSADWDERLKGLPRLLRYAMLVSDNASHIEQRLMAEIDELCPNLALNAAWLWRPTWTPDSPSPPNSTATPSPRTSPTCA